MSATFTNLRAAILTRLGTLVGTGKPLVMVDDVFTATITGFPCALFEPSGHENDFLTNTDNLRSYAFDIYVVQEIESKGRNEAIRILAAAVDAVIAAFDADYTLSGVCDYAKPLPSEWFTLTITDVGQVAAARLRLVCNAEIAP